MVNSVTFSPDGRLLASAGIDHVIRLWDIESGQNLQTLIGHSGTVHVLKFSSDGKTLVSSCSDQTVRIWNVLTGGEMVVFDMPDQVDSVSFSADGKTLVAGVSVGGKAMIEVWSGREWSNSAPPAR